METVSTNEYNANSVPDSGSGNPVFSRECKAENVNLACLPLPEWQKSPSIRLGNRIGRKRRIREKSQAKQGLETRRGRQRVRVSERGGMGWSHPYSLLFLSHDYSC